MTYHSILHKQQSMSIQYFVPLLIISILLSCNREVDKQLIGVKIYEHQGSKEELFSEWKDLGINAAFSSKDLIANEEYMREAKAFGISTFVIFPVFFNPDELAGSPELFALTTDGKKAREEWVEFVCPSREAYRKQMVEHAVQIIRDYNPDGISIDFIRHFVFWEKVYPDRDPSTLPLTCFDSLCLDHFQSEAGLHIPESLSTIPKKSSWILEHHKDAWIRWRCSLISSMVAEISEAVREVKPTIKVNVHLVPWAEDDFQGAIKTVAGQDIPALAEFADFLSPMTYHHMVRQDPPWIHSIVKNVYHQTGSQVLPSIQVDRAYLDTELDQLVFERSLEEALKPPSMGVVFWSWPSLEENPEKKQVVQKHCRQTKFF